MATSKDHASNNSSDDLFSPAYSKRRRILSDSEASSSSSDQITGFLPRRNRIESDSEDEPESDDNQDQEINWRIPQGKQANISFSGSSGISSACDPEVFSYTEPHSFYFLFATEEVFEIIAVQTNIYAAQIKSEQQSNRLDKWSETNPNEIKRFFGLIIWMGLVRLPQIHLYWSTDEGYNQTFPRTVMSRNRFELLLRFVHFSNNEENDPNNRLCKIIEIMDILNSNFKKYYNPEEVLCVDESLVPFRGRIKFRQYSTQKRHRYGMKIFKLCGGAGYTYSFQVYTGKEENTSQVSGYKSSAVVMSLCEEILGKGHTICTDNWYTSVELAEELIDMHTHLVGTLRKNRRGNPQEVINKKLKRGEVIGRENEKGITVLKWKDKRDVLMLSTKHSTEMTTVNKKWYSCDKPKVVVEYNLGKASVDLSDQMIAYSSPLRRTVKWYKKLAIELLLNTCIVNALVMFKQVTHRNIEIPDFRMKIAMYLTKCKDSETDDCLSSRTSLLINPRHELKRMPGKARVTRRFCKVCYEKNAKNLGRLKAKNCTKKVVSYCGDCTGSPFLCLECFNTVHRK